MDALDFIAGDSGYEFAAEIDLSGMPKSAFFELKREISDTFSKNGYKALVVQRGDSARVYSRKNDFSSLL